MPSYREIREPTSETFSKSPDSECNFIMGEARGLAAVVVSAYASMPLMISETSVGCADFNSAPAYLRLINFRRRRTRTSSRGTYPHKTFGSAASGILSTIMGDAELIQYSRERLEQSEERRDRYDLC